MKKNENPIPLRSIVCMPRWLMVGGAVLSGGCIAAGLGMVVYAIGWAQGAGEVSGSIGGALGCIIGGAGGLFGTLRDWYRRLPATVYLHQVQNDEPHPIYRRAFWPAVVVLVLALSVAATFDLWRACYGLIQLGAIMSFISGTIEAMRRHSTRRARAVFALYADGMLERRDTEAIDDTRSKDARFDADVRAYLHISQQIDDLLLADLQ